MALALGDVAARLAEIAPLDWAEDWDNVGLLVEPPGRARVRTVLVTIDLTAEVFEESRRERADLIVAYHPPIFGDLTRLVLGVPMQRVLMQCVQTKTAVFSPHTSLDAIEGGVNDWLADGLGKGARRPLARGGQHAAAPEGVGQGRFVSLDKPVSLATLARRVKAHLGLEHVRIATAAAHRRGPGIRDVALCAGAGGAVVTPQPADVYLTGEMRHHDVLAAVERGTSVILCEHTNTERGFLPEYARLIRGALGKDAKVVVARADADPLQVG